MNVVEHLNVTITTILLYTAVNFTHRGHGGIDGRPFTVGFRGLDGCLRLSSCRTGRMTGVGRCFLSVRKRDLQTDRGVHSGGVHRTICKGLGLVGGILAPRRCHGCIILLGIAGGGGHALGF